MTHEGTRPSAARVHAALIGVQLAFGSLSVAGKLAFEHMAPLGVTLVRVGGAALVFYALARARGVALTMPRRSIAQLAGLSILGISANQICFLSGLERTSPINASVLGSSIPIFSIGFAMALRREPVRGRTLAGIGTALAGMLYLVGGDGFAIGTSTLAGDALLLTSSCIYGLYLVLVGDIAHRYGAVPVLTIAFAFGALAVVPFGAGPFFAAIPTLGLQPLALLLYLVFVPTVYTYLANAWALRFASSSLVAIYIYLQPIVAATLAMWILDSPLEPRVLVGGAGIFTGIALVTSAPAARAK